VVGGIVGVRKYIYDVFGDTINTTSRMESNSEPMQINVSEATYVLVKDNFKFIMRKPMNIKGKGLTNMYFLKTDKN
jgi:class 3 adenylate cyclase